jgi:hypothetical protein
VHKGWRVARVILIALLLTAPVVVRAQGCSLCKDATAGYAPQARKGLRRAILVLGIPAVAIFLGILVIARQIQPGKDAEEREHNPAPNATF